MDRQLADSLSRQWFIAQKLRQPFTPDLSGFDPRVVGRELRKYLPQSHWQVVEQWTR